MPNLMAVNSLRVGELQVYGQMVDAFYPHVSAQGKVDLRRAAPTVDPLYEELLAIGHDREVVQFLVQKALIDIPAIKSETRRLSPEVATENFDA